MGTKSLGVRISDSDLQAVEHDNESCDGGPALQTEGSVALPWLADLPSGESLFFDTVLSRAGVGHKRARPSASVRTGSATLCC